MPVLGICGALASAPALAREVVPGSPKSGFTIAGASLIGVGLSGIGVGIAGLLERDRISALVRNYPRPTEAQAPALLALDLAARGATTLIIAGFASASTLIAIGIVGLTLPWKPRIVVVPTAMGVALAGVF